MTYLMQRIRSAAPREGARPRGRPASAGRLNFGSCGKPAPTTPEAEGTSGTLRKAVDGRVASAFFFLSGG